MSSEGTTPKKRFHPPPPYVAPYATSVIPALARRREANIALRQQLLLGGGPRNQGLRAKTAGAKTVAAVTGTGLAIVGMGAAFVSVAGTIPLWLGVVGFCGAPFAGYLTAAFIEAYAVGGILQREAAKAALADVEPPRQLDG